MIQPELIDELRRRVYWVSSNLAFLAEEEDKWYIRLSDQCTMQRDRRWLLEDIQYFLGWMSSFTMGQLIPPSLG